MSEANAGQTSRAYKRRNAEESLWRGILVEHLLSFFDETSDPNEPDSGVPAFVERELRDAATCGSLAARGFVRVRCSACKEDELIPFPCRARAACPSCGARRMAQTAANLVDHVLPDVPLRQWVITAPYEIHALLLADSSFLTAFIRIAVTSIFRHLVTKSAAIGVVGGQSGAVTFIQRWSSAMGVFPHLHILVLDGVYTPSDGDAAPEFHTVSAPTERDEQAVSGAICRRVEALLRRRGLVRTSDGPDPDERPATPLDRWYANASRVRSQLARVDDSGHVVPFRRSLGGRRPSRPSTGEVAGFSVHARTAVRRGDKDGRERLARYAGRPPFSESQLSRSDDGRIAFELSHPRWTGETHATFEPVALIRRVAWMIPPPRRHLTHFHGVVAPASRLRPLIVPPRPVVVTLPIAALPVDDAPSTQRCRRIPWQTLLARVFSVDALECPRCHSRRRVVSAITQPIVVRHILEHLGLPVEPPRLVPARGPP